MVQAPHPRQETKAEGISWVPCHVGKPCPAAWPACLTSHMLRCSPHSQGKSPWERVRAGAGGPAGRWDMLQCPSGVTTPWVHPEGGALPPGHPHKGRSEDSGAGVTGCARSPGQKRGRTQRAVTGVEAWGQTLRSGRVNPGGALPDRSQGPLGILKSTVPWEARTRASGWQPQRWGCPGGPGPVVGAAGLLHPGGRGSEASEPWAQVWVGMKVIVMPPGQLGARVLPHAPPSCPMSLVGDRAAPWGPALIPLRLEQQPDCKGLKTHIASLRAPPGCRALGPQEGALLGSCPRSAWPPGCWGSSC